MRIAVNTRLLLPGKLEGLGRFTTESLQRITRNHPEHEFIFIFDRKYSDEFIFSGNITPVVAYPPARHPVLWYLFFDWGIPPVLQKYKPDLFLSPDGWLSLRTTITSLPVIHDLNFFHNPQWVDRFPRQYYNYFFPRFIHKATRIATVSEFSKQDICSRFEIEKDKVDVVYNGAGKDFHPVSEKIQTDTRKKYSQGAPYFLFLGLVHPRKNLTRIIEAYDCFRHLNDTKVKLLVVGSTKYWTEDTRKAYELSKFKTDIVFAGRLPHAELNHVLASAKALVYASLFEGFGIPILEAMRCEVPVITSNNSSMPEVGGDAVCYVDPYSVVSIAQAFQKIDRDQEYCKSLVSKSNVQLNRFSWDETADLLWQSIVKCMSRDFEKL